MSGRGLRPGSEATVSVHSKLTVLGHFQVGPDGSFAGTVTLPAGLERGRHTLIVEGTSRSGAPMRRTSEFTIGSDGRFGLQVYSPSEHPEQTQQAVVGAMALVLVAGGIGAGAASRRSSGAPKPKSVPKIQDVALEPVAREGDVSEVDVSNQDRSEDPTEIGDRSITYRAPGTRWVDRISFTLPNQLVRFSPLLARVVNDGSYLRAMFGSLALLVPCAGLVLGVVAAVDTGRQALAPATGLCIAIVVLGIVDVLAGFLAALVFSLLVLFSGGVHGAADLRCLIDVDIVFFSVIMVVSATRSLRREPAGSPSEWYDRWSDVLVGGLLGMWALSKAIGVLPGLAGVEVPLAQHTLLVSAVAGGCVMLRYLAETLATHWYPLRLSRVAPPEVNAASTVIMWVGMIGKSAVFAFFAASYMGYVWELYLGGALLLASLALGAYEDLLPNWPRLKKLIPAGMLGVVFGIALGNWVFAGLGHVITDADKLAAWSFFLISIPYLVVQIIGSSAREGEGWEQNFWTRLAGIPTLVFTVLFVQGVISLG